MSMLSNLWLDLSEEETRLILEALTARRPALLQDPEKATRTEKLRQYIQQVNYRQNGRMLTVSTLDTPPTNELGREVVSRPVYLSYSVASLMITQLRNRAKDLLRGGRDPGTAQQLLEAAQMLQNTMGIVHTEEG